MEEAQQLLSTMQARHKQAGYVGLHLRLERKLVQLCVCTNKASTTLTHVSYTIR